MEAPKFQHLYAGAKTSPDNLCLESSYAESTVELKSRLPVHRLRRWGLKLAERGGKNAKKRAVVAVAQKLAVLLHKLWVSGEVYEPLRNNHKVVSAVA